MLVNVTLDSVATSLFHNPNPDTIASFLSLSADTLARGGNPKRREMLIATAKLLTPAGRDIILDLAQEVKQH